MEINVTTVLTSALTSMFWRMGQLDSWLRKSYADNPSTTNTTVLLIRSPFFNSTHLRAKSQTNKLHRNRTLRSAIFLIKTTHNLTQSTQTIVTRLQQLSDRTSMVDK